MPEEHEGERRTVEAMTLGGEATSAEGFGRPDEVLDVPADLDAPVEGDRARLAYAIEELLRSVLDRWQLPATWSIEGDLAEVSPSVLEAASSVIREGIANAAKHADGREVAVRVLASDRSVEVSVEDHGRGFESSEHEPVAGHLGLDMLRRRVADVHGTLDVRSAPGKGTRVVARLPRYGQGVSP
jgi:two-component system sensor histidine kinase DevS